MAIDGLNTISADPTAWLKETDKKQFEKICSHLEKSFCKASLENGSASDTVEVFC